MTHSDGELTIDVRALAPRARHSTIFVAWQELRSGEAVLLVNDHDPLPLYFQFACEFAGRFRWEYLEKGPEIWRVRILKGERLDPGFVPEPKRPATTTNGNSAAAIEPLVLDTRPVFQRGESPCGAIDDAVAQLAPGQTLVLLVPFEPVPLYTKLGAQGFSHKPTQNEDGTWRIEFRKSA